MKTFEEKYTAWVDGKLSGEELAAFEKELAATPDAAADKAEAQRLGAFLRQHDTPPSLSNGDFFNHQLLHRIAAESADERPARRWWNWSLPQLVLAGAASLAIAAALFKTLIPAGSEQRSDYFAEIVDARTNDPGISATPVYTPRENVTILWLDGLDYLPASYKLD